jgi:hypothetical protein
MRERFRRGTTFGVVAGVAAAFAVVGMGSVGAAVSPSSQPASADQYERKVTICHRTGSKKNPFRTIRVSRNAVKAHLRHGDALGPCSTARFTVCHQAKTKKAKKGKKQTIKVKGARKTQRHLKHGDKLGKCKAKKKGEANKGKQKGKGKDKGKQKGKKKP